jgi:hypothetical protein
MSTFCHGIASAETLDKSGEIVSIKGLDITSLPRTGIVNYEHRSDIPGQICGKILTAKKIFSKDDCSNDNELHFWNKAKVPFVYITAELLDDYCQSGKDAAGLFRYSRDNPDKQAILGFSVEGSEIPNTRQQKILITRSIARKVTLTASPCCQLCLAELLESPQKSQVKDDFDEIFKSSQEAITLFKSGEGVKIYENYLAKKEEMPKTPANEDTRHKGTEIGTTKSGKKVFSHGHVGSYGFNPAEHKEASEHHSHAAVIAQNPKLADNHIERMKLHNLAAISGGRQNNYADRPLKHKANMEQATGEGMVKSEHTCKLHKKESMGWSQGKQSGDAVHFNHPEHGIVSIHKQPSGEFHVKHKGAFAGIGGIKGSFGSAPEAGSHAQKYMAAVSQKKILPHNIQNHPSPSMVNKDEKTSDLNKALTAGMPNSAPSTLVNGAAYQREGLAKQATNVGEDNHNFKATKKNDWNKRANQDYDQWPQKEKFEKFMKARMPHLKDGEIRAIGKTLALKKSIDFEKSLSNLVKAEPLKKSPKIDVSASPDKGSPRVRAIADSYAQPKGLKPQHNIPHVKANPEFGAKVANEYQNMKHDPHNPDVKNAYGALIGETLGQFKHLKNNGLKISRMRPGQENPYKNSSDVHKDIHENNHLWYYPTEMGFGSSGQPTDHPMLAETDEKHEGKPLLANDAFRIVHDYFGHGKEGASFGPSGEETAYRVHKPMYSPLAQKALATETRGQNSWVNYGPHGENNRKNPANTVYAEQKAGLMPDWTHKDY